MLKLIKLEWKKNNIGKYIRNAVILAVILCLFMFALAYLGRGRKNFCVYREKSSLIRSRYV